MTPTPLQVGQAPSELALNSAGLTPLAFANALRTGSSRPVYVAGLLRREPRIADWSTVTTPSRPDTEPRRLCSRAPRTSRAPAGVRTEGLSETRSPRWRP